MEMAAGSRLGQNRPVILAALGKCLTRLRHLMDVRGFTRSAWNHAHYWTERAAPFERAEKGRR
jgi:hypothetical protein